VPPEGITLMVPLLFPQTVPVVVMFKVMIPVTTDRFIEAADDGFEFEAIHFLK
jgi:hypothetical protein